MSRLMAFVDGENLTTRFESMLRTESYTRRGPIPNGSHHWNVAHKPGCFVWSPLTVGHGARREDLIRVHYYTTHVGDDSACLELAGEIHKLNALPLKEPPAHPGSAYLTLGAGISLIPRVYKKQQRGTIAKSVDINLCVEVMEYVRQDALDAIYLVTGDVDYLPLIQAVMRAGKIVYLAALSSGLSSRLPASADNFQNLDAFYFQEPGHF